MLSASSAAGYGEALVTGSASRGLAPRRTAGVSATYHRGARSAPGGLRGVAPRANTVGEVPPRGREAQRGSGGRPQTNAAGVWGSPPDQHCLISRAQDRGFHGVIQHTRTFRMGRSRTGPAATCAAAVPAQGLRGRAAGAAREERGDDESPECGKGPPEDPGTGLGTAVPRAGFAVRHGLHVPQGSEEGPAQAGPAVLLPDGGREGPPGLRGPGRRDPRQHVPPGAGALAGVAEAVPVHHSASGDLRRPGHAAAVPYGSQPGTAQRPGDPDDRRGTGTRRSSRTSSACT